MTIDGKVVVITGASSGIGLAAAALLAGETGMMPALLTRTSTFDEIAMPPAAVARAIVFAIDQPPDVDVGEIVVRPTAQA